MMMVKNNHRDSLLTAIICVLLTCSCQNDDGGGCTTCSQPQTLDFVVCENGNGNAEVNGEDTGTPYGVYISDLQAEGADCGI